METTNHFMEDLQVQCSCCHAEYDPRNPAGFKEKARGSYSGSFRHLGEAEIVKIKDAHPTLGQYLKKSDVICLACRKMYVLCSPVKRKQTDTEFLDEQIKKVRIQEEEMDAEDKRLDQGISTILPIVFLEIELKFDVLEKFSECYLNLLKELHLNDSDASITFARHINDIFARRKIRNRGGNTGPPETLLDRRPDSEQVEYCHSNWVWISLKKDKFIKFCANPVNKYRTMTSLRVGFERFLKRMESIEKGQTTIHDISYRHLTTEEIYKVVAQKDLENINLKREIADMKMMYEHHLKREELISNDSTIDLVVNTIIYLKNTFGKQWQESFLNRFTQFVFTNAGTEAGRGKRYDAKEYGDVIAWLKHASVVGGGKLYRLLHGDGNPEESEFRGYHPAYHNFAIPSPATLNSIVSVARSVNIERSEKMRLNLVRISRDLKKMGQKYCAAKFDGIFLKKKLEIDSENDEISGIAEGKLKISEWNDLFKEHGMEIFEEIHYVNQAYCFMLCSLDRKLAVPFHSYGLYNDSYTDLVKVLKDAYDILWGCGIKLRIVISDGGSSCRKALKSLIEDPKLRYMRLIPFSDGDHLMKTIRNKTAKGDVQCNGIGLKWQILKDLWKGDKKLQDMFEWNTLIPQKDKMRSDWMRSIMKNTLLVEKLKLKSDVLKNNGDLVGSIDHLNLSMFLKNTNDYLTAWESLDEKLTHVQRYNVIYNATQFLTGHNKDFIISNLTDKAVDGLLMNLSSWSALLEWLIQKGQEKILCWRVVSTMTLENFFSRVRSINNNPTILQFDKIFDVSVEQFEIIRLSAAARGWTTGSSRLSRSSQIYGQEIIESTGKHNFEWVRKKKEKRKSKEEREKKAAAKEEARVSIDWLKHIQENDYGNFRSIFKGKYTTTHEAKVQITVAEAKLLK